MWMIEYVRNYLFGEEEPVEEALTPKYTEEEIECLNDLSREEHTVFNKLDKHYLYSQLKFSSKVRYSKALSTPQTIRSCFLHHKFKKPVPVSSDKFVEQNSVDVAESLFHFYDGEDGEGEEFVLLDMVNVGLEERRERPMYEKGMKIQIVISNIEPERSTFSVLKQKVTTHVCRVMGSLPTFGIWHTSVIVGGVKLEWNDSALVIPRPCRASLPILCVNLVEITSERQYNDIVDRLCRLVAEWNVHRSFDQSSSNCQTFVDELMKELDIVDAVLELPLPLQKILKKIKNEHMDTMQIEFSEEFMEKFGLKDETYEFHTHEELDDFVNKLIKIDPNFVVNQRDISFVLKCFDRSFWLDHLKKPNEVNTGTNCPFQDPETTLSFNSKLVKHLPKFGTSKTHEKT